MVFEISPDGRYVDSRHLNQLVLVQTLGLVFPHEFQNRMKPCWQDVRIPLRFAPLASAQARRYGFLPGRVKDDIFQVWLLGFARRQTVDSGRMNSHVEFAVIAGVSL